ncbi:MAG TPA: amino acid adenylation domain-containing protein [Caulobacteraceae bacterium]|jgi:amino acid adenylation domain-containing protein
MFIEDLGGALLQAAELNASRPALWAAGARLTYQELFDRASRISAALVQAGLSPGDRVAILSGRSHTAYAAVIGALLAGCTYLPLNIIYPQGRNQAMLRASGARALVVDEQRAAMLETFLEPLDDDLAVIRPEAGPDAAPIGGARTPLGDGQGLEYWRSVRRRAGRDQFAYILFTSGSTGAPKGVPITHANLDAYLTAAAGLGPLTPADRILQMANLTFDLSVHDMFLTWLSGAELYSMPERTELLAPRMIAQHQLTGSLIVPSVAARMIEKGLVRPGSMPSLRLGYFCGEPLPMTTVEAWRAAAPDARIINLYGPTECTVVVCAHEVRPEEAGDLAIAPLGRLFGAQKVELFTPGMTFPPSGEYGQICIAGSQVLRHHWEAPELDAAKFTDALGERWFKTGDMARWIEPHGLVFAGRADRQVKIRGYRVEMAEIEAVVRRVSGRPQVAALPWPVDGQGVAEGSVAFLGGPPGDAQRIRAGCRAQVAEYMVPDRLIFLPELPVNANGKVDYRALAQHPHLAGQAGH